MKYLRQRTFILSLSFMLTICAAQDLFSIIHGTVKKIDKDTRIVVVKTADGTEHTIKVAEQATVYGTEQGFDGLKEGSEIVVRCTDKGAEKTADDLGKVSKDGMKVTKARSRRLIKAQEPWW